MVSVSNLGKKYGEVIASDNVTFDIKKGEIVGLLGPNGAGKTTIMRILTCFIYPTCGEAILNGFDIIEDPLNVKKSVGYLPENAPIYTDLNVIEYLDFIADSRRIERKKEAIDRVIQECGLEKVVYRRISEISKGFKQRTGLAQAIVHNPEILILDEPTTGLDPNQIIEIRQLIKRLGEEKTVILSTHIMQEVEATCKRVLILNEGKIVAQGTTEEIGREMAGDTLLELNLLQGNNRILKKEARQSLSGLRGVRKVVSISAPAGQPLKIKLSLDPLSEMESEVALFDWAVENGYKILTMIPKKYSLEDIFTKITGKV